MEILPNDTKKIATALNGTTKGINQKHKGPSVEPWGMPQVITDAVVRTLNHVNTQLKSV